MNLNFMKKNNWIAFLLCAAFAMFLLNACGDSVDASEQDVAEVDESSSGEDVDSSSSVKSSSSKNKVSSSSTKTSSSSKVNSSSSSAKSSSSMKSDGSSSSSKESSSSNAKSSSSSTKSSSSETDVSSSSTKASSSSNVNSSSSSANSSSSSKEMSSSSSEDETFKPDDAEYPYAGIPRIVIETEKRQEIKDRETEIPAKLQIWGEDKAESEILDLTIRGRGNTSWNMPKKSYKIEFAKKQSILGMPKDKDWALIANYADKTLMRNYLAYRLSAALDVFYAPRCEFAELYLNDDYLGVYLITETVKIGENRVNIPKNDFSYIVEVDGKYKASEQVVFSDVLTSNNKGKAFRVHNPKNASEAVLDSVQTHIQNFEKYLKTIKSGGDNNVDEWIDIDECIRHYWVQEFAKNPDAEFYTSVYFSWIKGDKIKMGPVWDFDLAFGNHSNDNINVVENWHIRKYWYHFLFRDEVYKEKSDEFWALNHDFFVGVLDSIDVCGKKLNKAAQNNFKRWPILENTDLELGESYDEATDDLKQWIDKRMQWIDSQIGK